MLEKYNRQVQKASRVIRPNANLNQHQYDEASAKMDEVTKETLQKWLD